MEQEKEKNESKKNEEEIPLCLNCLHPVDPLHHYCPHCGRAVGQLTPIMPYESIRWQVDIWGKMWNQLWSKEISAAGKLFRLFMIIWNVPVMLIGVIPILWQKKEVPNDKQ
jgi:hypothetical protein